MKRRVLRAHTNKRRLRLLSAEHSLRLDAYNILCDASFLRAVALANNNGGSNGSAPAQALKSLMYDTFAAATSHVTQETGGGGPQERKTKEVLSLSLCYLPETATALRRMVHQQPHSQHQQQQQQQREKKLPAGKLSGSAAPKGKGRAVSEVAEALLAGLECVGRDSAVANRNEAKAIAQFVTGAATTREGGEDRPYRGHERKNAHFFFVATQSHDTRRLLPGNAALLRLTTSPTALWIEKNGDAFQYDDASSGGSRAVQGHAGARRTTTTTSTSGGEGGSGSMNGLSAADVAFMRHLSADLVPDDRPGKRRRVETLPATVAATYDNSRKNSAAMDANVNGTPARSPQGVGAKKGPPHRKGARGPNPLAVKKKRVREVFRVGTGAQAKPKQGTK